MLLTLNIFILAILQGLTEFIPVSSSGHLAMGQAWLGLEFPGITVEIVLHVGTLISILVFYRRRIAVLTAECVTGRGEGRRYAAWILLASVPAALLYAVAGSSIEALFGKPDRVGLLLMANGALLLSMAWLRAPERPLRWPLALAIGVAQACALLPGISRSGMTIAMARRLGVTPRRAAEFSLLMSVPAVAGAALLDAVHLVRNPPESLLAATPALFLGLLVSAAVGWLAIVCIVRVLSAGRFWMFGIYCLAVGALAWRTL